MASDQVLYRKNQPVGSLSGTRSVERPKEFGSALAKVMKSHSSRHWKTLIAAMGEMQVPLSALAEMKQYAPEFTAMLVNEDVTLADLVLLQQYAKAIQEGDTKAATFLRDTAGMAPIKEVSVSSEPTGLQSLSDEELRALLAAIVDVQVQGETSPHDDQADSVAYGLSHLVEMTEEPTEENDD